MASNNPRNSSTGLILTIIVLVIVVVAVLKFMNGPDRRSTGTRVGDVVDSVSNGNSVGESLDRANDRTPAQKVGDDLKDEGHKIKNDLNGK